MNLFYIEKENTDFHEDIHSYSYFFDLEKHKWTFTPHIEDSRIIPISTHYFLNELNNKRLMKHITSNQILLVWHIETCGHTLHPKAVRDFTRTISSLNGVHNKILFVHTNELDQDDPQFIHHALMFNRQKLYFTEYDENMCRGKFWVWSLPKSVYTLSDINKQYNSKTFLVLNRVKETHGEYPNAKLFQGLKRNLQNFLLSINANMHISNPAAGILLGSNGYGVDPIFDSIDYTFGGLFSPVADEYYNTSYISICVESVFDCGEIFYPSEKYYDHLIKGNFPLIFAGPKVIHNLKRVYGFKFPDWIDYSYDDIDNLNERFESFLQSVKKVSEKTPDELHNLYLRDKHILEHNRNIFFTTPYDSLYDKVKDSIEKLGW